MPPALRLPRRGQSAGLPEKRERERQLEEPFVALCQQVQSDDASIDAPVP